MPTSTAAGSRPTARFDTFTSEMRCVSMTANSVSTRMPPTGGGEPAPVRSGAVEQGPRARAPGGGGWRHPARLRRTEAETAPPPPRTAVSGHALARDLRLGERLDGDPHDDAGAVPRPRAHPQRTAEVGDALAHAHQAEPRRRRRRAEVRVRVAAAAVV